MPSDPRGFDVSAVLDDRIRQLESDLRVAHDAVNAIPEMLRSRLAGGLRNQLVQAVQSVDADLATPARDGRLHPADAWARLHAKRTVADALMAECLSLAAGAAVRTVTLGVTSDDGWRTAASDMCEIADALVDEMVARTPMVGWDSFTILGAAESFDYATRLIAVRFPAPTVWDLPATAHELGHYAARTMGEFRHGRMHNLVDGLHDDLDPTNGRWYWVEELFGDAFATWVLGPAYGLTSVLLAFDPLRAYVGSESHPPCSERIRVIAAVLDTFDDPGVRWLGAALTSLWQRLIEVAEAAVTEPVVSESWSKGIVDLLHDRLPYGRYSTFMEARRLAPHLGPADVRDTTTLADVVNASWLARIDAPGRVGAGDVNRQGTAAAVSIVRREH